MVGVGAHDNPCIILHKTSYNTVGANCVRPQNLHRTTVLHKPNISLQADDCRSGAFPAAQKIYTK